ncbi:MAG: agmatine deiminase family protein, partial [Oceanobacter sp.]
YHAIIAAISNHQDVIVSCAQTEDFERLGDLYRNQESVTFLQTPNNDTWARDHGPISCYENNKLVLKDFQFNGWGNKYASERDNKISQNLHQEGAYGNVDLESEDWVLEGGSLETDGSGTLLTTTQCLLNPNRNPTLTKAEIEKKLEESLGIDRVLWLEHGELDGDDTDAHIDTLARFAAKDCIIYCQAEPDDKHFDSLNAMEAELKQLKQSDGSAYKLIPLPLPAALYSEDGNRLPATYANFLIINEAVLLPVYGVEQDKLAIERMMQAFPEQKIYPIYCRPVVEQYGSLHCLTMQIHKERSL